MNDDQSKRREISQLIREAANIFSRRPGPELDPALPKMLEAVELARTLDDKTPLLICQANLAYMNAVCGRADEALGHIDNAMAVALEDADVGVPLRNFVFTRFVEIAIMLGRDHQRALTTARALVQSAVDEEGNYQQFLAAVYNLAVVCHDLLKKPEWTMALLSWMADNAVPTSHPYAQQARRSYRKTAQRVPEEERDAWLSGVEANRDGLVEQATAGYLPQFAPSFGGDGPSPDTGPLPEE